MATETRLPTSVPVPQPNFVPPSVPTVVPPPESALIPPVHPVPQQIVIQFAQNTSFQQQTAYLESIGASVDQKIDALNTVVVTVPEATFDVPLPSSAIVTTSEPDYYVTALDGPLNGTVNDPLYADQWALPVVGAPDAWAALPLNAPTVRVAVIDSGVCADHPDLAGRIEPGWDFLENDADPQDAFGHGCAVVSVIAANINDGIGMAGVAPNAQVMPLRVLDAGGIGSYSDVAAAIVYAVDHGAQVINLSLGGAYPSSVLENAVNYAVARGVTVVAAAGNTGTEGVLYPARYEPVVAVGSLDRNLERSDFSTFGPEINLWAPGRDILTANVSGGHSFMSGTSFAAPAASGVFVLQMDLGGSIWDSPLASLDDRKNVPPTAIAEPIVSPMPTLPKPTMIATMTQPADPGNTDSLTQAYVAPDASYSVWYPATWTLKKEEHWTDVNPETFNTRLSFETTIRETMTLHVFPDSAGTGSFEDLVEFYLLSILSHDAKFYAQGTINGTPLIMVSEPTVPGRDATALYTLFQCGSDIFRFQYTGWYGGQDAADFVNVLNGFSCLEADGTGSTEIPEIDSVKFLGAPSQMNAAAGDSRCLTYEDRNGNPYKCSYTEPYTNIFHPTNCVWWANYSRPDLPNESWGDAYNWDNAAKQHPKYGSSMVVKYPEVGAIAVWESGHVGYVVAVGSSGKFKVSHMNWGGPIDIDEFTNNDGISFILGGVTFFEHADFGGSRELIRSYQSNLNYGWGISSIFIPAGWDAVFYRNANYDSSSWRERWGTTDLHSLNSSFWNLSLDNYSDSSNMNDNVRSARVASMACINPFGLVETEQVGVMGCGVPTDPGDPSDPSDTTRPQGSFTSPSPGSTIKSRTVTISVNASDDSSGVREVNFSAKWGGTWRGIGSDTTAPYSINWDMCNANVPNGDIELGMEVRDNAGNLFIWSAHGGANPHITKNYSCGGTGDTTAGGPWNTHGWMNSYLAGYTNWEGTITWDNGYPYVYFDWGSGGPFGWGGNDFSLRLWRQVYFPGGDYDFYTDNDDGVRVYVDNKLVVDRWWDGHNTGSGGRYISQGNHEVKVEYYEKQGDAKISVVWYGPGYPRPDQKAPTGRITAPGDMTATNSPPLTIWADASDDASGVERVDFYAWYCHNNVCDWRLLGSDKTAPYSYTWNWSSLPDMHVWLSIDVYDKTGKVRGSSTEEWVEVDLDRTAPKVAISNMADGGYLNTSSVSIKSTATDSQSGIAALQFFVGYSSAGGTSALTSEDAPPPLSGEILERLINSAGPSEGADTVDAFPTFDSTDELKSAPAEDGQTYSTTFTEASEGTRTQEPQATWDSDLVAGQSVSDVTALDYWHEVGWDKDGSNGWSFNWNTSGVSDQDGVSFFVYAYDKAGNYQGAGVWNKTLDKIPPSSRVDNLATTQSKTAFTVRWAGTDNYTQSSLLFFDVQYQVGCTGSWINFITDTNSAGYTFNGEIGKKYCFRSRAHDLAGNAEAWPTSADTHTTIAASPTCRPDTVGIYRDSDFSWYLRNSNSAGFADIIFNYGLPSDRSITGDWDGDGYDTVGIRRGNTFYLKNSNTTGIADITFRFGTSTDIPVAGDWNGDGIDTIGFYRPATATWYLRNSNSAGPADLAFAYGLPNETPVTGDWDGNGVDTVGIYRDSDFSWYLRNSNSAGFATIIINFGLPSDDAVTGDWNGDCIDTVGIYRPGAGNWYLKNTNTSGIADLAFAYGLPNERGVTGKWLPSGGNAAALITSDSSVEVSATTLEETFTGCEAVSDISVPECEALVALYDSTNGDSWTDNSGWLQAPSPCNWSGVECFGEEHVEALRLNDNNLKGTLPPELGDMNGVEELYLNNNALWGEIPSSLANLPIPPERVDIGYNMLTASNTAVIAWLNVVDPNWTDTQTVPPIDVWAAPLSDTSITVSWTPISYTGDSGHYEVHYGTVRGGPYVVGCTTTDKTQSECTITGLAPGNFYYFVARTFTPSHTRQSSDLLSPFSQEIDANTNPTPPVTGIPTDEPTAAPPLDESPVTSLQTVESDDLVVQRQGEWTAHSTVEASGGSYLYSSGSVDDILTLRFLGEHLDIVYVQHPALGVFGVEVDGVVHQTVDTTSPGTAFGVRVSISGLDDGDHEARIYPVSGTIALDAFALQPQPEPKVALMATPTPTSIPLIETPVLSTLTLVPTDIALVQPTLPAMQEGLSLLEAEDARVAQTGAWTAHLTDAASGGAYLYSSGAAGESLTLAVNGGQREIVYVQHPALGRFAVEVDGQVWFEVDAYAANTGFGARAYLALPPGTHTLRVVALEGTIALDAFAVETTPQQPSPTPQEQGTPTPGMDTPVLPDGPPTLDMEDTPTPTGETQTAVPAIPTATPTAAPLPLPFVDSLDSPAGWLPDGAWQFAPDAGYQAGAWSADAARRATASSLTFATPLNLRWALQPRLSFWQRGSLPAGDLAAVEVSLDGGLSWLPLDLQPALPAEWTARTLDLTAFHGAAVLLRFRLQTTAAPEGNTPVAGAWTVDQLTLQDAPLLTPTAVPTDVPTRAPLPTTAPVLPSATALPAVTPTPLPTFTPWPTSTPTPLPTATPVPTAPEVIPPPTQEPSSVPFDPTPTDIPLE